MTSEIIDFDVLFQCQSTNEMHHPVSHPHYAQVNRIQSVPWLKC